MRKTIFIAGGHLTPALAVIEEIQRRNIPWDIVFVGRKLALEGEKAPSVEYQEIHRMGIPFLPLTTGRLTRTLTPLSFWSWFKIPVGFVQAFYYVLFKRPALIVSFGGYVALPVAVAAACLGIPVVTHEQTAVMGLANRIIGHFSRKIFLSFPKKSSTKHILTGLPIRSALFHPPQRPSFSVSPVLPLLYITGGSTGAVSLNERVFPIMGRLVSEWVVIHQTGQRSLPSAASVRDNLPADRKGRYLVAPYFSVSDVAWIYHHAAMVISRAGANTVGELAALGKVAMLIPLPWSGGNEQMNNAKFLEVAGSAMVISQNQATPERVLQRSALAMKRKPQMLAAAQKLKRRMVRNGAKRMVDELILLTGA